MWSVLRAVNSINRQRLTVCCSSQVCIVLGQIFSVIARGISLLSALNVFFYSLVDTATCGLIDVL